QYDKENPIDYDRYSGVAELTALEYEALFGPAMYGSAEPVLNGFYVGYQYFVNGITYSNTLYIDSREKAAIKHYVRKQQKDSLEVCYDIVRPDHSRLRVKQRKLAVDINVNSVFE
ncbi:MAG: hypothetical protein KI786_18360, partial [Mameliella sp.]|nr:hypothetical protein [Phaeodactylibacter sp.]